MGRHARRRYLWLHDEVRPETIPRLSLPHLRGGGVLVLSEFHEGQLPTHAMPLARRTSNGLDDAAMVDGPNDNMRFLYASSASAGLLLLLRMWAKVREALGDDATLHVYYGFWPYAMWEERRTCASCAGRSSRASTRATACTTTACARRPSSPRRTPPDGTRTRPTTRDIRVALMKAQACGCVPLTSGQRKSALTETVGEWDAGPKGGRARSPTMRSGRRVCGGDDRGGARPGRDGRCRRDEEQARKRFSWATVARQWTENLAPPAPAAATPPPTTPAPPAATKAPPTARRARARLRGRRRHRGGPGGGEASQQVAAETASDETAAEEERLERELVELRAGRAQRACARSKPCTVS